MANNETKLILTGVDNTKSAFDSITDSMKRIEGDTKSLAGNLSAPFKSLNNLIPMVGSALAASGITTFLQSIAAAAGESELQEVKLAAALAAHGVKNKEVVEIYKEYAAEIQKTTVYNDEAVMSMMRIMTTMGVAPKEIKPATEAALGLASAFGLDLNSAGQIVAQMMEGNYRGLGKLIPAFKGAEKGAVDAAGALAIIRQHTGDMAQKELDTYTGKVKRFGNAWDDFKEALGAKVLPVLSKTLEITTELVNSFSDKSRLEILKQTSTALQKKIELEERVTKNSAAMFTVEAAKTEYLKKQEKALADLRAQKEKVDNEIIALEEKKNKVLDQAGKDFVKQKSLADDEAAKKAKQLTEHAIEETRKASYEIEGIGKSQLVKDLARIDSEVEKYREGGVDKVTVAEYTSAAIALANAKASEEEAKGWRKAEKEAIDSMEKQAELGVKLSKESIKRGEDRLKAEREIYKDLRKYSGEYFEVTVGLINEQAKKYRDLGVSEVAIQAWVKEETTKAYIEMGKKSDSFFTGVSAGYMQIQRDSMTFGKLGYETISTFASSSSNTMSTVFFDKYKGETKSAGEYWTSFTDTMVKKFFDSVSQMLIEWAFFQNSISTTNLSMGAMGTVGGANAAGGTAASALGGLSNVSALGSAGSGINALLPSAPMGGTWTIEAFGGSATIGGMATAAGLGYLGGSMLGKMIYRNSGTGAGIGGALGAGVGMLGGPLGAIAGGAIGSLIGGGIESIFGGSNAGFGSASHTLQRVQPFGKYPEYGTFFQLGGSSSAASPDTIQNFKDSVNLAIQSYYVGLANRIGALSTEQQKLLNDELSTKSVDLLPSVGGLITGNDINLTREEVGNLQTVLDQIPATIESQISGILRKYGIASAATGIDYVPRDNMLFNLHKGERVLTKEENAEYGRTGGDLHFHFPNALIVDRNAVNELARVIYPRLKYLEAKGH